MIVYVIEGRSFEGDNQVLCVVHSLEAAYSKVEAFDQEEELGFDEYNIHKCEVQ